MAVQKRAGKENKMAKHNDNTIKRALMRRHSEENLIDTVFMIHLTLTLYVLHNKFGFGEKRLTMFAKEFGNQLECYDKGLVNFEEIKQSLKEDTGIEIIKK